MPNISQNFSSLHARLAILEAAAALPPLDMILLAALTKIGIDFRTTGPRYTPTKKITNTLLPDGALTVGNSLRIQPGATVEFEGWDFTGLGIYCETGTVTFRDCYIPNATGPCLYLVGTAAVTAEWCDLDGLGGKANPFSLVTQFSDSAYYIVKNSRIHGGGGDCVHMSSNSTIERCWLYDAGYNVNLHPDLIQLTTEPGAHSNMKIINNLLVGGGPNGINQLIRAISEKQAGKSAGSVSDILVQGNVCFMPSDDFTHSPFALGRRISPANAAGLACSNNRIVDNWLSYGASSALLAYETPTGYAEWANNRNLDTGAVIPSPTGWTS